MVVNKEIINDHDYVKIKTEEQFLEIKEEIKSLQSQIERLTKKLESASSRLTDLSLTSASMMASSDADVRLYTGFPSYAALGAFYLGIEEDVNKIIKIGSGQDTMKVFRMDQFLVLVSCHRLLLV